MGWLYCAVLGETQFIQCRDTGRQARRALRPVPDKQADPLGLLGAECLARHQPGDRAAGVEAAGCGLHMVGQAPVEFALQQQVQWLRQLLGDGGDLARRGGPVLARDTVATTDRLTS